LGARRAAAQRDPSCRGAQLDYKTVRHHLNVLGENDIVDNPGDDYGVVTLPIQRVRQQ
jgi:hypothetical protein